jgi:hypothetical protein
VYQLFVCYKNGRSWHNISAGRTEELIFDSDVQFMSSDSCLDCKCDLSEDGDHGIVTFELWCCSVYEDKIVMYQVIASNPGLNCSVAPHMYV